jgi:Family of unknown function (DUF6488)
MRNVLLSVAILATFASPALAHPEHEEMSRPIAPKPKAEVAKGEIIKLVTQAKLDASWSAATATKTETRVIGGAQRWVVTFQNAAIKSAAKRTLYVVLAQNGDLVSYSFTPR